LQISIIISQVTPQQIKNEYSNAQHTVVKNGVFINYNIFLY